MSPRHSGLQCFVVPSCLAANLFQPQSTVIYQVANNKNTSWHSETAGSTYGSSHIHPCFFTTGTSTY